MSRRCPVKNKAKTESEQISFCYISSVIINNNSDYEIAGFRFVIITPIIEQFLWVEGEVMIATCFL